MINLRLILVSFVFFQFGNTQETTLLKNINFRAQEVKHYLNSTKDSLILESERPIRSVYLYNREVDIAYEIEDRNAQIFVNDLEIGRYVVEVVLIDKRIILTLLRGNPKIEDYTEAPEIAPVRKIIVKAEKPKKEQKAIVNAAPSKVEVAKNISKEKNNRTQKNVGKYDISKLLNTKTPKSDKNTEYLKELKKEREANASKYEYWVVRIINNGYFSKRIHKMANYEEVQRLIKQNELEINSRFSNNNILKVWQVLDKENFMIQKRLVPNYMYTVSDYFEFEPYYSSQKLSTLR